jgi:hypothetical protein
MDTVRDLTFEIDSLSRCRPQLVWQYPSHATAYMMTFLRRPFTLPLWQKPADRPPRHAAPHPRLALPHLSREVA